MDTKILVSLGGGFSSTAKMPRILVEQYPRTRLHFVNCVLPNEHPSTWELMDALENTLDIKIEYIAYDPKNKWQFVDKKDRQNKEKLFTPFDIFDLVDFVGNTRRDPCSMHLKRKTILHYVQDEFTELKPVIAIGINQDEFERAAAIRRNWQEKGYELVFPLRDLSHEPVHEQLELLRKWYNVSLPLYELGFEHNNCHGACVKAGQRQWAMLWYYFPEVYLEWEEREQKWIREHDGASYPFLRKQVKGRTHYLTLHQFRQWLEKAVAQKENNFIVRMIEKLPGNPACMWCSAI